MASVQGTVHNTRLEQEGSQVVLRFVLQSANNIRIPVEMRGRKVSGLLDAGDRVEVNVRGRRIRDRDGIARPQLVRNLTTESVVRTQRHRRIVQLFRSTLGFLFSSGVSIGSGVLVTLITDSLMMRPRIATFARSAPPASSASSMLLSVPVLLGIGVGIVLFFLIYLRPHLFGRTN
ncbi:MAG: hypothetical protein K8L99_19935 [Anaerolineae bacterium]|nr:hypothetical protein [Anaerolineae bacterium]